MNVPWGRGKLSSIRVEEEEGLGFPGDNNLLLEMEVIVPSHFLCPISLDLMKDPVILPSGITYDRESIEKWIEGGNLTCPVSNQPLSSFDQIPNHSLRRMIQWWCVENKCYGVKRIPTPCAPVAPHEVAGACKRILTATNFGDTRRCMELVLKMKRWGKDSERNKKCVAENGAGCALSSAFESFSKGSKSDDNVALLEEILSVLVWAFPLGVEGQARLGSVASLSLMVWMLKSGDLSVRRNVALVLRKLVSSSKVHANALLGVEGIVQELFRLVKEPICPPASKASLMTISYLVPSSERALSSLVDMGLVSLLVEVIVDGDKSMSEKALLVLDRLFDSQKGREEAHKNDLLVPVLFAKISVVPDLASELCVSILWKLAKSDKGGEGVVVAEALQLGERSNPFQKLLVLLQVGCGESTKHKVKELLKLLNLHRAKMEYCVGSSMDFRYIKRSY